MYAQAAKKTLYLSVSVAKLEIELWIICKKERKDPRGWLFGSTEPPGLLANLEQGRNRHLDQDPPLQPLHNAGPSRLNWGRDIFMAVNVINLLGYERRTEVSKTH